MAALLAVAAFVAPWEGRELLPYRDIVGVWTVCYGHTGNVEARRYTEAECDRLLTADVSRTLAALDRCIAPALTEPQWVAVADLGFNVGASAVCRSTMVRKINAGYPPGVWCRELLRWNRAGGKVVRGLTRRREAAYRVCVG